MKTIKIFGDKYKIRKTYDINESGFGIYGYEVYDEDEKFLRYYGGIETLKHLRNLIKIFFYKRYESTYSYNK